MQKERKPKVLIYDIEVFSWGMGADSGLTLSVSWKWLEEKKVYSLKSSEYKSWNSKDSTKLDKGLLKDFVKVINQADLIVGAYSSKFDRPWINSRCLILGLPHIDPLIPEDDTWRLAKYKGKFTRNSLKVLSGCLNNNQEKTDSGGIWTFINCMRNLPSAWNKLIKYNQNDVLATEEIYLKLRKLASSRINRNLFSNKEVCPTCGEQSLNQHGSYVTKTNHWKRFICRKCHSTAKAPIKKDGSYGTIR